MKISLKHRSVILAIGCVGLGACSKTEKPEDVARAFITDSAAGRGAKALERIDPAVRPLAGMLVAAAPKTAAFGPPPHGSIETVEVLETNTVDPDHATVETVSHFGDGTEVKRTARLRRVDGRWYITM